MLSPLILTSHNYWLSKLPCIWMVLSSQQMGDLLQGRNSSANMRFIKYTLCARTGLGPGRGVATQHLNGTGTQECLLILGDKIAKKAIQNNYQVRQWQNFQEWLPICHALIPGTCECDEIPLSWSYYVCYTAQLTLKRGDYLRGV